MRTNNNLKATVNGKITITMDGSISFHSKTLYNGTENKNIQINNFSVSMQLEDCEISAVEKALTEAIEKEVSEETTEESVKNHSYYFNKVADSDIGSDEKMELLHDLFEAFYQINGIEEMTPKTKELLEYIESF